MTRGTWNNANKSHSQILKRLTELTWNGSEILTLYLRKTLAILKFSCVINIRQEPTNYQRIKKIAYSDNEPSNINMIADEVRKQSRLLIYDVRLVWAEYSDFTLRNCKILLRNNYWGTYLKINRFLTLVCILLHRNRRNACRRVSLAVHQHWNMQNTRWSEN